MVANIKRLKGNAKQRGFVTRNLPSRFDNLANGSMRLALAKKLPAGSPLRKLLISHKEIKKESFNNLINSSTGHTAIELFGNSKEGMETLNLLGTPHGNKALELWGRAEPSLKTLKIICSTPDGRKWFEKVSQEKHLRFLVSFTYSPERIKVLELIGKSPLGGRAITIYLTEHGHGSLIGVLKELENGTIK